MRIYRISTNPQKHETILDLRDFEDTEDNISISVHSDDYAETGYFSTLNQAVDWIETSDLIFLYGEVDTATCFDLGLCSALSKPVFLVSNTGNVQGDELGFSYSNLNILPISVESFADLLE